MIREASGVDLAQGDAALKFDLVSTWTEDCGIYEYARALVSNPPLAGRIGTIFAHKGAQTKLGSETSSNIGDTSPVGKENIVHCWRKDSGPQDQLIEGLMQSKSQFLWVQYHPSFFAPETRNSLAKHLQNTSYKSRILSVHNPEGLKDSAFAAGFTHIIVHNENALAQMGESLANKLHIVPHFIYSRNEFEKRSRGSTFTIATAGFAAENKQVPLLIDAFSIAHGLNPDMRLHILTSPLRTHAATFELSRIKSAAMSSRAAHAIKADLGDKSMCELMSLLSQAHLLCMPYSDTNESASGAARLGLSAGVPILRSNSSIFCDLPGGDLILEDTNVETLAEAILMLSKTPVLLEQKTSEIDEIYSQYSASEIAKMFDRFLR